MRRFLVFAGAVVALIAILAAPGGASGAIVVKNVDTTEYPRVGVTVVTGSPSPVPPTLEENGAEVAGLEAENLGRAKSVVLAIDRSQSMGGGALDDAIAGARAFIGAKPSEDRIAVISFGHDVEELTDFSTATIDPDIALRTLSVDDVWGTALHDAVGVAARMVSSEAFPSRVLILLTDGQETSSSASLEDAIAAAGRAGVAVYPIGIESKHFNPAPLQRLAAATGGTYYGAESSDALRAVYASIAEELRRTWQLSYLTSARPGEELELRVEAAGGETVTSLRAPGVTEPVVKPEPSRLVPRAVLEATWGPLAIGLVAGVVVLIAAAFALASPKGSWVRNRIGPHLEKKTKARKRADVEHVSFLRMILLTTEQVFSERRFWVHLQRRLERADLPLRTAEFAYMMAGAGLAFGLVAALAGASSLLILAALACGALVPYMFIGLKGRKRSKLFENQLPDLLVTMAASLKAGHSFRQGMQSVVEEGGEPASKEFKRVLTETQLGRSMDHALADMSARVGSKNLQFVINAVTIQRQVGGSLAELFDMVADTVRNRQQFERKVKGLTSMGRASAWVLICLPFFVAAAVTALNAKYMSPLYTTSTGHKLMLTGVVMMGIGSLFLRKIVSFKG